MTKYVCKAKNDMMPVGDSTKMAGEEICTIEYHDNVPGEFIAHAIADGKVVIERVKAPEWPQADPNV